MGLLKWAIALGLPIGILAWLIKKMSTVTTRVSNWVNVNGRLQTTIQHGMYAIASYNGKLYAAGDDQVLYEFDGSNIRAVTPIAIDKPIKALIVFNGSLYGAGYSERLYRWNGVDSWVQVANVLGFAECECLAVYNGKIYGGMFGTIEAGKGKLYEWNGVNAWVEVAPMFGTERGIFCLAVYNNRLYGGTNPGGKILRWNDVNAWEEVTDLVTAVGSVNALAVFNGKLYATCNSGFYEWNGTGDWKFIENRQFRCLLVYNNKLYGGSGDGALWEWDGVNPWINVASKIENRDTVYFMAEFGNKLYAAMSPEGGAIYLWYNSITTTVTQESSSSVVDLGMEGARVRTVRHITTLTPWLV